MDFTLDPEQVALRDAARSVARRHAPDHGAAGSTVGPGRHDPAAWAALAELGALGLPFAEEAGGLGASAVEAATVAGELGRAGLVTVYADALVAGSLLAAGGDSEMLSSVVEGEALVLTALAASGRPWTMPVSAATAAQIDDEWVLTGARSPVSQGDSATHLLVPATTEEGVAVFVVDPPAFAEDGRLVLEDTPARLLIGPEDAATALRDAVDLGLVLLAAEAVGAMDTALALTVDYLRSRKQFGVPLMTFQTLTQRAADMYTSVELARSAALFGAMVLGGGEGTSEDVARMRVVVGRAGRHVGQEAVQLHGGIGMTAEYAVGHLTTRLTAIEHTWGDTRWHLGRLAERVGDHPSVDVFG